LIAFLDIPVPASSFVQLYRGHLGEITDIVWQHGANDFRLASASNDGNILVKLESVAVLSANSKEKLTKASNRSGIYHNQDLSTIFGALAVFYHYVGALQYLIRSFLAVKITPYILGTQNAYRL
jgi:hypothetical protein